MSTTRTKRSIWRKALAALVAAAFAGSWPMQAWAAMPKPINVPPPAMPAHIKKGSKEVHIFEPKVSFSDNPTDADLSKADLLPEHLAPMSGTAVAGENSALAKALLEFRAKKNHGDISALTDFLSRFPTSRWRPALEVDLGLLRLECGYFSDAFDYWRSAWEKSKHETDAKRKAIADNAVSQLTVLQARLGRKDELKQTLTEIHDRHITGASLARVIRARKGYTEMSQRPGIAYKCGPLALQTLLALQTGQPKHSPILEKAQSTDHGTSLAQLKEWSDQVGMHYQMAKREKDAAMIVPSVMHLKVGHFVAITKKENDRYRSKDPTFGTCGNIAFTPPALESQSDGYFLVPDGSLPKGWQTVSKTEGQLVFGKGYGDPNVPPCPCQKHINPGPSGCSTCGSRFLASASVYAMQDVVEVEDTPLQYSPPVGPTIAFHYSNIAGDEFGVPNPMAYGGRLNWYSYLTVDDSSNVTVVLDGGSEYYPYPYAPNFYTQAQIVEVSSGVYQRQLPDGSIQVYNQPDGYGRILMTEVIDPQGNSATITFNDSFQITAVTDAIGQVSTFTYDSGAISQITDPFGRSCSFTYEDDFLTSTTDSIGLTSQIHYSAVTDNIDMITTPYGSTSFNSFSPNIEIASDPLTYGGTGVQFMFPDGTTSVIIGAGGGSASTSYWDREAMQLYPSDCVPVDGVLDSSHSRYTRWCVVNGEEPPYAMAAVPYLEYSPLEAYTNYTYPGGEVEEGAIDFYFVGSIGKPSTVTRGTGDTTQEWQYTYNSAGNVTQAIDPVGRTFSNTYADNNIDLLEKQQTLTETPDINGIWSSYSDHLPGSYEDGSGQVTSYTYNDFGEITTLTDAAENVWTYTYDDNGYLTQIQGPLSGSNDITTISYDGYGRVYQVTDAEGYTLTYSYDNADRVTQVTFPDGTSTQTIYDKLDAVLLKDRDGRWTQRSYDSMDQLVAQTDPLGQKTQYSYCACGSLSSMTDPNGNVTTWQHDLEGRVTQKIYPDGSSVSFSYDYFGRLGTRTDALGQVTTYSYNLDNTLSQIAYSNTVNSTSTVTYSYDPDYPRLASVENGWGTISYDYNPYITSADDTTTGAGMVSEVTNSVIPDSDITYSYDVLGRVTNRSINGDSNSVGWTYDAISRITQEVNALGTFGYTYVDDQSGYSKGTTRLSSISYPNGQVTNFNWFGNQGDQRLQGIINLANDGATCLSQFAYGYDPAGEITSWQQQQGVNNNNLFKLHYDRAGQLISSQAGENGAVSPPYSSEYMYGYDPAANRVAAMQYSTRTVVVGGSPTSGDVVTLTITDAGLSGGQESVNYTVGDSDTLDDIASNLASAINADTNLQGITLSATSSGADILISNCSANLTTFSSSLSGGATETVTYGTHANTIVNASVVGTPTTGDTVTITALDPALSGGQESVTHTVTSGETLSDIGNALYEAINADSSLAAINVTADNVEGAAQITSNSANVTTFTSSVNTGATEGIVFSLNTNLIQFGAVSGSTTSGDVMTLTVYDAALSGGSESVDYTVGPTDGLSDVAIGLANAVNGDSDLTAFMSANTDGASLYLDSDSLNATTYRVTSSSDASETLVLMSSSPIDGNYANFGGSAYQYDNLNELVSISSGGMVPITGKSNKALQSGSIVSTSLSVNQSPPPLTFSGVQGSTATEFIGFNPQTSSGQYSFYVGGTATTGDVVSLIVYNSSLPGRQEQVNYTVLSTDSLDDVATGLAAAINADSNLASLGLSASASAAVVNMTQTPSYSYSVSDGGTEWLYWPNQNKAAIMAQVGGSATAGDVIAFYVFNPALSGGEEYVTYSVQPGDDLVAVASGLAAVINADSTLSSIGITASNTTQANLPWSEEIVANTPTAGYSVNNATVVDGGSNSAGQDYDLWIQQPAASPSLSYDLNGNLTNDGTNSYSWDAENRLLQITYPGDGNYSAFTYDGLGRNVETQEYSAGTLTSTKQFVWCDTDRCENRDNSGTLVSQYFGLGQVDAGTKHFYVQDHLGSIREMTDEDGALKSEHQFDPYGNTINSPNSIESDFQYAGYYHHARSGLALTLERAYSTSVGRWLSRDPAEQLLDINTYFYADNSPTELIDPLGMNNISPFNADVGADIGRVLGAGTNFITNRNVSLMPGVYRLFDPTNPSGPWYIGSGPIKRVFESIKQRKLTGWVFTPCETRAAAYRIENALIYILGGPNSKKLPLNDIWPKFSPFSGFPPFDEFLKGLGPLAPLDFSAPLIKQGAENGYFINYPPRQV